MEIYTHLMVRTLVYGFEYENRYFAVYMSYVGAPACVADIEDTMSIINKDKYVVLVVRDAWIKKLRVENCCRERKCKRCRYGGKYKKRISHNSK